VEATLIETTTLARRFDEVVAVDRLDLAVSRGSIFGLLHPGLVR
jgi:ABC-type branched-subunit amino acid transport system ATPase component